MIQAEHIPILIVDDMQSSRMLLSRCLRKLGFQQVVEKSSVSAALNLPDLARFKLVISDYHMPNQSGLDFLSNLRSTAETKHTGFILVTSKATRSVVDQGRTLGMNNIIQKPFTDKSMRRCIEQVIGPIQD